MKEDILEQIAEDYFLGMDGYFTKSNVKYRPNINNPFGYNAQFDSVNSDIDVVAYCSKHKNKIFVVNCKSWQGGLDTDKFAAEIITAIKNGKAKMKGKRDYWANFRELCISKWTYAFVEKLKSEVHSLGRVSIDYTLLCTKTTKPVDLTFDPMIMQVTTEIKKHFSSCFPGTNIAFSIKRIDDYLIEAIDKIDHKITPSVENTHLSRTIQLFIASDHRILKRENLDIDNIKNAGCAKCGAQIAKLQVSYCCPKDYLEKRYQLCSKCYASATIDEKKCTICGNSIKKRIIEK